MLRILTWWMMPLVSFLWSLAGFRRYSAQNIGREGVIFAIQALMPVHVGIDNKNVCNNVGRIIDDWSGLPFCLCTDGDLLACIAGMLRYHPMLL